MQIKYTEILYKAYKMALRKGDLTSLLIILQMMDKRGLPHLKDA